MTAAQSRTRRRRARRRLAVTALVATGVLGGGAVAGVRGLEAASAGGPAAAPGQASVRLVRPDTTAAVTYPSQTANGPSLPLGPPPSPLAVDLSDPDDPVQVKFSTPPRAGLLFDLDTGKVLWRRNATRVLPMASVTKMMTAVLVDERIPAGGKVLITRQAAQVGGSKVGVLPEGKRIGVQTLLYGLLLPSGNDAATALAQRVSGTTQAFVALMNERAKAMHLQCTRFASPSGLVDEGNRTCAYDLAALARELLDHPRLAKIVAKRSATLPFPIEGGKLELYNNNPLLKRDYPGTLGIKTGYTDAAGKCLVAAVERDGRRLGVILLGSPDIGTQGIKLMDRGFASPRRDGA